MKQENQAMDLVLLAIVALLVGIGLIMVFSASSAYAYSNYSDPYYVIKKQGMWGLIGLGALVVAARLPMEAVKKLTPILMVIALALLVAVIAGFGTEVNGATAWIDFKIGRLQPSELAKLVLVLFMARTLSTNVQDNATFMRGLAPNLLILGLVAVLIMMEPDLGSLIIIAGTIFVMMLVGGINLLHLGLLGTASAAAGFYYVANSQLRWERVKVFLDPWSDPTGKGFQPIQALYALGSGGLQGVGLGESSQKLFHLPEQHTDLIFAILGEELGFLGAISVVLLFIALAWRGFMIAMKVPDLYSSYLATGLTTMLVLQAIVNMAVVVGMMPVTGVTLPFISYGGSSLLFSMVAVGLLLNVSRQVQAPAAAS